MGRKAILDAATYRLERCASFCRTKEQWGLFSNMASGFPLLFAGRSYPASESLYQALRFVPHSRDIALVVGQLPAGAAKRRAYEDIAKTRPDWADARLDAMRLVLWLKAEQHPAFREALLGTGTADIVEISTRGDAFWGAVPDADGRTATGINALGRLLMEIREGLNHGEGRPAGLAEGFIH